VQKTVHISGGFAQSIDRFCDEGTLFDWKLFSLENQIPASTAEWFNFEQVALKLSTRAGVQSSGLIKKKY